MKRAPYILGLALALATPARADEIALSVTAGALSGKATLVNQILPNGTKYVRLSMTLSDGSGKTATILQESTYDVKGRPIRKLQVTSLDGGSARQSIAINFAEDSVKFTVDQGGTKSDQEFAYPEGKSILALPEFWFIRDPVAAGGVNTYSRFDLEQKAWIETKCTYHGKRDIEWNGKKVKANFVTMGSAKAWLDEKGDPYLVESDGARMVRIPSNGKST